MILSRDVKEAVRGLIGRLGLAKAHAVLRRAQGENVRHLMAPSIPELFAAIYQNGVWRDKNRSGSLSGRGSEVESTQSVRDQLPELLNRLGTQVLLDVGCGDFNWMRTVKLPCSYLGLDVVPSIIDQNSLFYGSATLQFICCNAINDPLPPADTTLCREVLFHLCFRDALSLLSNIMQSGTKYLLATNDTKLFTNADILSGDYRMLNLLRRPFSFPPPIASIPDDHIEEYRELSVWNVADIRAHSRGQLTRLVHKL